MSAPVDLSPAHLSIVERILAEHVPDCEVRAFGSRATWTAKDSSDLDLAIVGEDPLDLRTLGRLKEAFEESRLPMRVDVLDWHAVTDSFRATIESDCLLVQQPFESSTWRRVRLGEAIEVNPPRSLARGTKSSFAAMADILANHRLLPTLSLREFKGGGSRFRNDDTLFARITPSLEHGKTAFVSGLQEGTTGHGSTEFIVLSAKEGVTDPRFVYYLTRWLAFRAYAIGQMTGTSGRQRVPADAIGSFEFLLPPLEEQRGIAHILGTLDDKIELNRRMNETLEAMTRALFQDWFVHFGPTRAKMEGREPYLPPNVWALFPDRLVPSALGEIPEGWQVRTLGEIVEQVRVSENPLKTPNTMFKHFSIAAYDDHQVPRLELGKDIKSVKTRVEPGVILLSKLNPEIERVWLVDVASNDRAICSTEFIVLEPRPPFQQSYVYCLSRSSAFRSQLESLVTGTSKSHQRVPPSAALAIAGLRPTTPILDAFETGTTELLNRIASLTRENGTLIILRDTLLAKLMSESNINRDRIYG